MKTIRTIYLIILFCSMLTIGIGAQAAQAAETYSREQCIRVALENNASVRSAGYTRQVKDIQASAALYTLFPQLSAALGYAAQAGYDYTSSAALDDSGYTANLQLTQTLFASGKNSANLKIARKNQQAATAIWQTEVNRVTASISTLYYQVLRNARLCTVKENALQRKKDNFALVSLLYQIGNEKKPNLDQIAYDVAHAEYELARAENDRTLALKQLKQEMGLSQSTEIVLAEVYTSSVTVSLKDAVARALNNRPDLQQADVAVEINALERVVARSAYLPVVAVSAGLGWSGDGFTPPLAERRTALSVSIPLSSGFPVYATMKENSVNRDAVTLTRQNLATTIEREVAAAHASLALATTRLALADQNNAVARNRASLANLEYQQGSISFVEFEDIEANLSTAEQELVDARFALESAKAELLYAMGGGTQ